MKGLEVSHVSLPFRENDIRLSLPITILQSPTTLDKVRHSVTGWVDWDFVEGSACLPEGKNQKYQRGPLAATDPAPPVSDPGAAPASFSKGDTFAAQVKVTWVT
jgi:hypothetical protein